MKMRKEYDLSDGERRKFHGKADTKNPIVEADEEISTKILEDTDLPENIANQNKCSN